MDSYKPLLLQPSIVPYPLTLVLATILGSSSPSQPHQNSRAHACHSIRPGLHGRRSGSLSLSGAICASALGYLVLANPLRVFGVCLLTFYFAGSQATKVSSHSIWNKDPSLVLPAGQSSAQANPRRRPFIPLHGPRKTERQSRRAPSRLQRSFRHPLRCNLASALQWRIRRREGLEWEVVDGRARGAMVCPGC
jgi:hypothetical protein